MRPAATALARRAAASSLRGPCLLCRAQALRRASTSTTTTTTTTPQPRRATPTTRPAAAAAHTACRAFSSSGEQGGDERHFIPLGHKTHYDLFPESLPSGPPPGGHFPIDARALRREFLQLQARAHPDLHPASSKPAAEAASALINEAYRTLASPLLRAQYLLSLRGVDVANDETLKVEEPDLLMLVLETREEIEEARSEADLEGLRAANDDRIRQSEEILDRAFADDDVAAAKREAVRLRYWVNIKDSLDNWEEGKPVVLEH